MVQTQRIPDKQYAFPSMRRQESTSIKSASSKFKHTGQYQSYIDSSVAKISKLRGLCKCYLIINLYCYVARLLIRIAHSNLDCAICPIWKFGISFREYVQRSLISKCVIFVFKLRKMFDQLLFDIFVAKYISQLYET